MSVRHSGWPINFVSAVRPRAATTFWSVPHRRVFQVARYCVRRGLHASNSQCRSCRSHVNFYRHAVFDFLDSSK